MTLELYKNRILMPDSGIARAARQIGLVIAGICFCLMAAELKGQVEPELKELKQRYEQAVEELRVAVKSAKRAEALHFHVESDEAFEYREQWEAAAAAAEQAYAKLRKNAIELFQALPAPDDDLIRIVRSINGKLYLEGQIATCYDVSKKLAALDPTDANLANDLARVAILSNDFETAASFADGNLGIVAEFPKLEKGLYTYVDTLQEQFAKELEIRKAEAAADDLPRVELKTTKGDIVIELFENEAPETVGNFINLVEIEFFDEIIFHPVYKMLLAQTGLMSMDRLRDPGYTIYDEHQRADARRHFRGSVCMATDPEKVNSGSSQFYILNVPGPHITDRHTVFGRVISGMEVVDSLQPTKKIDDENGEESTIENITPDSILSARVLRKRDHEYEPNRVKKESTESSK